MKKISSLLLIFLLCKFCIAQKHVGTWYDYNHIHPKEDYYVNSAGQPNGPYKLYDEKGVVIKEYNYLNGGENGLCIDYAATGNNQRVVISKGNFINGKPDGAFVEYCHEDGYKSKVQQGQYKNGKKNGLWKEWWCTTILGNTDKVYVNILKSVGAYKDGKYNGTWSFYHETGNIDYRANYKEGLEDGTWTFYDPSDSTKILNTSEYLAGKRIGRWKIFIDSKENETTVSKDYAGYKILNFDNDGNPTDTILTTYFIAGPKFSEVHVRAYKDYSGNIQLIKDGLYTQYFASGKIEGTGHYHNDKGIGDWKSYYESGAIYEEGSYKGNYTRTDEDGLKKGKWNTYYESGKIKSMYDYGWGGISPSTEIWYDENGRITKSVGGGGGE